VLALIEKRKIMIYSLVTLDVQSSLIVNSSFSGCIRYFDVLFDIYSDGPSGDQ